ncbi:MAG: TonB-dependent receptor [Pseudomonadota bacterium]
MFRKKKSAIALTALTLGLDSASVLAQLEEVVVTARKREESLQDVPVVVTAISGESIEKLRIQNLDDLGSFVPGMLSASGGGTDPGGTMSLRGIKTGGINLTSDQSISLNMDGMQIESVLAYRAGQVDLAQVEVLKGPQALFFGKNSPGGVISVTTANPTDQFFLSAKAGYEIEDGDESGELVVSGPLTDTLGARGVVNYLGRKGFMSNDDPTATYSDLPEFEQLVARGTLEWTPSDTFRALAKVTYTEGEAESRNDVQKLVCFNEAATSAECNLDNNTTIAAPLDLLGRYGGLRPFEDTEGVFATLRLEWELGNSLSLTSITGYYDVSQDFYDTVLPRGVNDVDIFGVDENGVPIFLPNEILNRTDGGAESISQEFRIESSFDGPLNFMAGVFIDDRTMDTDQKVQFGVIGIPQIVQSVDAESLSVFGQVDYDITEQLELSVGLRYTDEEKTYSGTIEEDALLAGPLFVITPPPGTPPEFLLGTAGDALVPTKTKISPDNVSPEATLSWRPTEDTMFYASYKQGFKSGSFDTSSTLNQALLDQPFDVSFDNEEVDGGEVGFKTVWADNQLRVNGAAYFYTYENLQLSTFDPIILSTRTLNAGEAEVNGFEIDFEYAPISLSGFRVYGSYNYNKAEYNEFINSCSQSAIFAGQCPDSGLQSYAGTPLTLAPEHAGTLGFDFAGDIGSGLQFSLGALLNFSDEYQANSLNDPLGIQDSFTTLAVNASIGTMDGRWTLAVLGRNMTDEDFLLSTVSQPFTGFGGTFQQDFTGSKARGRAVTIQLTYRFE